MVFDLSYTPAVRQLGNARGFFTNGSFNRCRGSAALLS
jgi:hypothetical protein